MIRSGLRQLDAVLSGAPGGGLLIDVYGPAGSGKSQLAMQMCAAAASAGGSALYVDTTGGFRPERVAEMAGAPGALERVMVRRATDTAAQAAALGSIRPGLSLAVVDSATDLFSLHLGRRDQALEKNSRFMSYMRRLSLAAYECGVPAVLTNMVRSAEPEGGGEMVERENMSAAMAPFAHVRVRLARGEGPGRPRRGEAECPGRRLPVEYAIGPAGLEDARGPRPA